MQYKTNIFIVSDKFKDFSQHDQVLIYSELIAILNTDLSSLKNSTLIPGQGLSESNISNILSLIGRVDNHGIDVSFLKFRPARAGLSVTHKRRFINSIISSPRKINADLYEADLLVDERSELMNDHQTGQHIQGMILIEAARQLFLAVTEDFFISPDDSRNYYFVINQMDTKYMAFVFPVNAILRYEVLEKALENPERLSFHVKITVNQVGLDATEVSVKFTTFLAEKIKQKEHRQAMDMLQKKERSLNERQAVQSN